MGEGLFMNDKQKKYIAIDLKSFYASVECIERGLNPMTTNLVVADLSRTQKTICLAVSPSLKQYNISGRARLFEVIKQVKTVNANRRYMLQGNEFSGKSYDDIELKNNPYLEVDYIVAPPRMRKYIDVSTKIYEVYLKWFAPEDMHIYSIDEVFIDVTDYLKTYRLSARELAGKVILDVLDKTGITATVGIGDNLYLAKIAMDIVAKRMPADKNGVRIAELDVMGYRRQLWAHRPITDFWQVGKGYQRRLEEKMLFTMGDIALCSIQNEDLLYKMFGVNAELLIDHAWGYEPAIIRDIKIYRPKNRSLASGQVLQEAYPYEKARIVAWEMIEKLSLDLVEKNLVCNQVVLTIGYDVENLKNGEYTAEIQTDAYGRKKPKDSHGTKTFDKYTSSTKRMTNGLMELFDDIVEKELSIRRINVSVNNIILEKDIPSKYSCKQMDFFCSVEELEKIEKEEQEERELQKVIIEIKKKFGKSSILKGKNLEKGATAIDRNNQVGGHRA